MRSDVSLNSIMVGTTTARVGDMAAKRVTRNGGNIRRRRCCGCSCFVFFLIFSKLAADQHGVRLRISQLPVQDIVKPPLVQPNMKSNIILTPAGFIFDVMNSFRS